MKFKNMIFGTFLLMPPFEGFIVVLRLLREL
jgi:hypothetical protein